MTDRPAPTYLVLLDLVGRLSRQAQAGEDSPLEPQDEVALGQLSGWPGPPTQMLHLWQLALALCTNTAITRRSTAFRQMVREIGFELLDLRTFPEGLDRTGALVVLEMLVGAAIAVGEHELADRALRRTRARMNELFVAADLGPAFLAMRPFSTALRSAAFRAFDAVDRVLAIEIAEAGRMKLLSAVAAGHAPAAAPAPERPETMGVAVPYAWLLALRDADAEAIDALVRTRLADGGLSSMLIALTQPWVRLAAAPPTAPAVEPPRDLAWDALIEPSLDWIAGVLDACQLLVYPFVTPAAFGFVVLGGGTLASFLTPREEYELPDDATMTVEFVAGAHLAHSLNMAFEESGALAKLTDVRFVAWDPATERAVQQCTAGFWMPLTLLEQLEPGQGWPPPRVAPTVVPSARVLNARVNPLPNRVGGVAFLGDPTGDLAGPWIEAIAWEERFGDRARIAMGVHATRAAALAGLREEELVVVSGHTIGVPGDEAFGIRLADGELTHTDLLRLQGEVRASLVILSCCSAATTVGGSVESEMLGLVTTLLALGVQHVMAPLEPVNDRTAGILGAIVAEAVAEGHDLRRAIVVAAERAVHGSGPLRASARLPETWREACPHDAATLAAHAVIGRERYVATLQQFTVFGGGLPDAG